MIAGAKMWDRDRIRGELLNYSVGHSVYRCGGSNPYLSLNLNL